MDEVPLATESINSDVNTAGILSVGIANYENLKTYTTTSLYTSTMTGHNRPWVWFSSLESFTQVLSEKNRNLLAIIALKKPNSITELATLSGRAKSNLSRTLCTMEKHNLVKIHRGNGQALQIRVDYHSIQLYLTLSCPKLISP